MKKLLLLGIILVIQACAHFQTADEQKTITDEKKQEILMNTENGEKLIAQFKTNHGDFSIQLMPEKAPLTVKNFIGLAEKKYYDGITFHRVIDNFMIQGGDPTGTGSSGESIYGGTFGDEFDKDLNFTEIGILAMANRGPNTNTSQFFITLVETPWLNQKHTIFGKVIDGMEIVQKIGKVPTTKPFDKPVEKVIIESLTIEKVK